MDLLPQPLLPPAAEVVVDGLPRRQVLGQQPPGTARAQPVQHRVEQLAALVEGRPPAGHGLGDERAEDLPLGVGQVGAAAAAGGVTARSSWRGDGEAPQPTAFSDTL